MLTLPMRFKLLAGACMVCACGDDQAAQPFVSADAGETVSYTRDVKPIFARCTICHYAGSVIDYDLTDPFDATHGIIGRANSWKEAHDSPYETIVEPGDAAASFLIYKVATKPEAIDAPNNGAAMPLHTPYLGADELGKVRQWISDGARDDAFFQEQVAPIFGTALTLGSRAGKCTFCHYPGSSTGLDILAVFDADKGLVGAESLFSDKLRVKPGEPDESFLLEKLQPDPSGGSQMPLQYARLSEAEVETLRTWIDQGAPNN
jgi:hypothetical protein